VRTSDELKRARASFARRSWGDAHKQFEEADATTPLDLEDLERLAIAAYLSGEDEESTRAWTRAHHEAIQRDDPRRAARNAVAIGSGLLFRGETAPAMGWFARGARVLEGCDDCPERAWLQTWNAFVQMWGGDPEGAHLTFAESTAAGQRFDDSDLVTMSRLGQGMCLLLQGQGAPGMTLLDESMVGVTSGEVSRMYAGIAYCTVIAGCSELFDLQRARQWTAALTRWCDSQPDLVPYRGNCLVHRCQLMQLEGAWAEAAAAAQQACDHLSGPVTWDTLGSAHYQLGELQRLRGEYADAEASYRKANESGHRPEPGLALLRLAQGRSDLATSVLRRALNETQEVPARSRILPAYVETMIAVGDVPSARTAPTSSARWRSCWTRRIFVRWPTPRRARFCLRRATRGRPCPYSASPDRRGASWTPPTRPRASRFWSVSRAVQSTMRRRPRWSSTERGRSLSGWALNRTSSGSMSSSDGRIGKAPVA